ncbi:hypothetical protein DFH06DRAFT_1149907 [Mycena polygramma]|nr:hypothetical protein DFH06DRAFT_1149907 [Mycena polygramma]
MTVKARAGGSLHWVGSVRERSRSGREQSLVAARLQLEAGRRGRLRKERRCNWVKRRWREDWARARTVLREIDHRVKVQRRATLDVDAVAVGVLLFLRYLLQRRMGRRTRTIRPTGDAGVGEGVRGRHGRGANSRCAGWRLFYADESWSSMSSRHEDANHSAAGAQRTSQNGSAKWQVAKISALRYMADILKDNRYRAILKWPGDTGQYPGDAGEELVSTQLTFCAGRQSKITTGA